MQKLNEKLKDNLLWNAVLRTIMQTSLEFGFCCYFTIKFADIDGTMGTIINISYAYVFSVLLIGFPIFCLLLYVHKFRKISDLKFEDLHVDEEE